jgi:hypothetical protein
MPYDLNNFRHVEEAESFNSRSAAQRIPRRSLPRSEKLVTSTSIVPVSFKIRFNIIHISLRIPNSLFSSESVNFGKQAGGQAY